MWLGSAAAAGAASATGVSGSASSSSSSPTARRSAPSRSASTPSGDWTISTIAKCPRRIDICESSMLTPSAASAPATAATIPGLSRPTAESANVVTRARRHRARRRLPAAGLEELRWVELGGRDADHGLAEARGDARQDVGVAEVRRRLDDRLRAQRRIARLEDAGADEDAVGAELHAEGRVGGRRDAAGGERDDRQPAVLRHPAHELVRRTELLRLGIELVLAQRTEPPDAAEHGPHVR